MRQFRASPKKKVTGKISPDLRNLTAGNFGIVVTLESVLERNIQVKIFLTLEITLQLPVIRYRTALRFGSVGNGSNSNPESSI